MDDGSEMVFGTDRETDRENDISENLRFGKSLV